MFLPFRQTSNFTNQLDIIEHREICEPCKQVGVILAQHKASLGDRSRVVMKVSELSLGTLQELLDRSSSCSICPALLAGLANVERSGVHYSEFAGEKRVHLGDLSPYTVIKFSHQEHDNQFSINYSEPEHPEQSEPAFSFLPVQLASSDDVCARPYDSAWISIDIIRQWLQHCDCAHGKDCQSSAYIPVPQCSINLIDLHQMRLVTVTGARTYVVLSYVWGNVETLQTTKANFESFQETNALNPESDSLKIPETIRDAMRLSAALGQRYLWVDALCIIQDEEPEKKQAQLDVMGSIYANAYLTIVAAQGKDASHGMRGVGHGSQPRNIPCHIVRFPGLQPLQLHRARGPDILKSPWVYRGWTYQESTLSRRILIIGKEFVDWNCKSATWNEELIIRNKRGLTQNLMVNGDPGQMYEVRPWPCMPEWHKIAMHYGPRQLGFDSDAEPAFSGMLGVMSRFFHGGFHFAIPEMFFDIGLLWRPFINLRRRQVNGDSYSKKLPPSWSWLGWEGAANCWDYIYCSDYLIKDPVNPLAEKEKIIITPLVHWTRVIDLGEELRATTPILNSYCTLRSRYSEIQTNLEVGWSVHSNPAGLEGRKYFYTHSDIGDDVHFAYPIPLKNSIVPIRLPQTPYLSFRTELVWLCIAASNKPNHGPFTESYHLKSTKGHWVGLVQLHLFQDQTIWTNRPEAYIAISAGKARNEANCSGNLPEWKMDERPKEGEFYEFINVFLVKWKGNVAYRQGIGRVSKEAWERETRKEVNIDLG
jgi:hypothetical protein